MIHYELGIKKMVNKNYCVACLQIFKKLYLYTENTFLKKHHFYSNEKKYLYFIYIK